MKTINDLPVKVLANILFFTTPRIDILVKFRILNSKWDEAVKHRLFLVKHLIQTDHYNVDQFTETSICEETMFSVNPKFSYPCTIADTWEFIHLMKKTCTIFWDESYTRYFISLMDMIPCLKAVNMPCPLDSSLRNKIFTYLNSRPTLKALGLGFSDGYAFEPENQEEVKLKNITMLEIKGTKSPENLRKFTERLFPADHEFQQLYVNDLIPAEYILRKMPKIRKLYHSVYFRENSGTELPLFMPNNLCDLEILGLRCAGVDIVEYLSKVTSLSPKLTSIHLVLSFVPERPFINNINDNINNFKQFNQVENLVIEYRENWDSFWYGKKILRMYPMVKNLSIRYSTDLKESIILDIFQWMPNLAVLYLVYTKLSRTNTILWVVNIGRLVSAYHEIHGRWIKIRVEENKRIPPSTFTKPIFKSGFDFMKHIFYSESINQPHILLE